MSMFIRDKSRTNVSRVTRCSELPNFSHLSSKLSRVRVMLSEFSALVKCKQKAFSKSLALATDRIIYAIMIKYFRSTFLRFLDRLLQRGGRLYHNIAKQSKVKQLPLQCFKKDILFFIPNNGHYLKQDHYLFFPQVDHLVLAFDGEFSSSVLCSQAILHHHGNLFIPPYIYGGILYALIPRYIYWSFILSSSRPRLIAGVCLPRSLVRAAFLLKIPCVELFHSYCYLPESVHRYGFNLMPSNFHCIVYDDKTFDSLQSEGVNNVTRARLPYIERKSVLKDYGFCNGNTVADHLSHVFDISRPLILVTLQHSASSISSLAESEFICDMLPVELVRSIRSQVSVNWILRWHPAIVFSDEYQNLSGKIKAHFHGCDNVSVNGFNFFEPIDILKYCSLHITMNSATTYEAALVGVKTYLLCSNLLNPDSMYYEYFSEETRAGVAEVLPLSSAVINICIKNHLTILPQNVSTGRNSLESEGHLPLTCTILRSLVEQRND